MCNPAIRASALMPSLYMPGISVPAGPIARPRSASSLIGAAPGVFPGRGAPTGWSEMTGFPVRHQY
jgi:hypothetical protein